MILSLPSSSFAQSPPPTAGWQDGFVVQSADGNYRLQFGLLLQFDGRFAIDDIADATTGAFTIPRARMPVRGRIADRFEFTFGPDVAGGRLTLLDAYIDTRFSQAFRVRVGKAKVPVGTERQISDAYVLFLERGLTANIAPNRDLGVQALGDLAGGRVSYAGGLYNGSRDGASADVDTDDAKDVAGRLVVRPVAGVRLAIGASSGNRDSADALPVYRTTLLQQTFFSYDSAATADGRLNRVMPAASYHSGRFGVAAEYARSWLPVSRSQTQTEVAHHAWQTTATYVLTGEGPTDTGVTPKMPFNFGDGGWGAVEVTARYHQLTVDQAALDLGLAAAGSSRKAAGWSVGVNWYWNRVVLYRVQFERTVFDDNSSEARPPENVLAFRSQINF